VFEQDPVHPANGNLLEIDEYGHEAPRVSGTAVTAVTAGAPRSSIELGQDLADDLGGLMG
jgi:hypothetical protein